MFNANSQHKPNSSIFPRSWMGSIAYVLVLALLVAILPQPASARWRHNGDQLPGISNGVAIGLVAGVGALVGVAIYFKKKGKGSPHVKLEAPPVRFEGGNSGEPERKTVGVTNIMNDPVTVKAVAIEDKSGAFALADARQVPFTLAPGEKAEFPVMLTAKNGGGKARLRLLASAPKLKKDAVKYIDISYGHKKSKLRRLVPGI